MGMRMAGVVMIDGDPVEPGVQVGFHLLHQVAGGLPRVGQLHAVFRRDDEAELVAVVTSAFEEGAAILHVAFGGIGLALLAVAGHAVALEIAQMRVYRLGADKLATPSRTALRIELYDAGLHRDAPRPCADAAPVPAPSAAALQDRRSRRTSAPRVESSACLPVSRQAVGICPGTPDRLLHLGGEADGPTPNHTDPPAMRAHAATITDAPETDAEGVIFARHPETIGGRNTARKSRMPS